MRRSMTIKLPMTEGETVVFWDPRDPGGDPQRGLIESNGKGAWTIKFQSGVEDDEAEDGVWWDGGGSFQPADLGNGGFLMDLAKAFASHCNRTHSSIIEAIAKGKAEIPIRKPVTLVRLTGSKRFKVTLTCVGDDSYGRPFIQLEQSRPLLAEELFVVCKRLAMASDWWAERMGDLA